jgi:hypothetical protein
MAALPPNPANKRHTENCAAVREKPPPRENATKITLPKCMIIALPYFSLSGAIKSGPRANAKRKMETCRAPTVLSVILRSFITR